MVKGLVFCESFSGRACGALGVTVMRLFGVDRTGMYALRT